MRSRLFLLFFGVLMIAAPVVAQAPSKILKDAERAMGGAKALKQLASIQRRGTIRRTSDGSAGKIVLQSARPNLYNISFDIGGFEQESGYNGKSGWTRDSRDGLRTFTGDESVDFQAEALFRSSLWLEAKREKLKILSGGTTELNGLRANVVVLTTPKGSSIKLYFDPASKLLLREEFPFGESTRTFDYSDYRKSGSLSLPYRMKLDVGGTTYDVEFEDVRANATIAKSEFDFPSHSGAPLPDIPTLLADVQANEEKVDELLDSYTYLRRSTRRDIGKDGLLRETGSETYQLSFYKGHRIARMVEKNGKPLSPSEQADEDKKAAEQAVDIEKAIAKREKREITGPPSGDKDRRISIAEVMRASKLTNPRRERFRDRDVIVFDFEPNPSFDYKNAKSMLKFFGKTAGAMWIDEKDKQVARLEAYLADSFNVGGGLVAKLKKGASFTLEQERVNDEIWLPSTADINLSVRVLLVKGIDLNVVVKSYDYRKSTTEVKDAKVDEIKQN